MTAFIDSCTISVYSGKGGDGMMHFRTEKFAPRGGPDGGDGGRGGDVILEVDPHLNTLYRFQHLSRFQAENGDKGGTNKKTGRSALDMLIPVPPGTLVFDEASGQLLGDLTEPGQRLQVCKGGRGGRGNPHFKNSVNQAPRIAEKGEPGEERSLRLELKLIADIGLVGAPNAGKSTLLAALTNAQPKIAPYPFTTLTPNLGVAALDEDTTLVLADIPGLIEGAHLGIGLGHDFLRHIQRTRILIHVLDGLAEDPLADFFQINAELSLFDVALSEKPQIVAFNKCDLQEVSDRWPAVQAALQKKGYEAMDISAAARTRLRPLLNRAAQLLADAPPPMPVEEVPVYRFETDPNAFTIEQLGETSFQVRGVSIERAAKMTYWEHDQSVRRFQRILEAIGIDSALREAGALPGHTVYIGEFELEWSD